MNNNNELMTARVESEKVIIEIPIDFIATTQECRDDYIYKILDKKAMGEYVAKNILDYGDDSETGLTAFHRLVDELFDEAYELAEEWLEEDEYDEEFE